MKLLDVTDLTSPHPETFWRESRRLSHGFDSSLDRLKSGNARTPALSPTLVKMLTEAWTIGSLDFAAQRIRTGFTTLALVSTEELSRADSGDVSQELQKIKPGGPSQGFPDHRRGLADERDGDVLSTAAPGAPGRKSAGKTKNLDQFTVDLTATPRPARSIRCWDAISKSARWSIF